MEASGSNLKPSLRTGCCFALPATAFAMGGGRSGCRRVVDHPADAVTVKDDAPVRAPRHIGHRSPFRAALGQGTVQAVSLFPAVHVEAEGGVVADAGLLAHRPEH